MNNNKNFQELKKKFFELKKDIILYKSTKELLELWNVSQDDNLQETSLLISIIEEIILDRMECLKIRMWDKNSDLNNTSDSQKYINCLENVRTLYLEREKIIPLIDDNAEDYISQYECMTSKIDLFFKTLSSLI
jgi:hypothetical protein